jgi:hypothetical protein
LGISWTGNDGMRSDSLRFDGAGRASAWLPAGTWRYRLADGTGGLVGVERYSDEFLRRPVTLQAQAGATERGESRTVARDWWWLFAVGVLGLCGEWMVRRQLGLR